MVYNYTIMKKIHILIENTSHDNLLELKEKEGRSLNYLVAKAIDNYLKSKRIGNPKK